MSISEYRLSSKFSQARIRDTFGPEREGKKSSIEELKELHCPSSSSLSLFKTEKLVTQCHMARKPQNESLSSGLPDSKSPTWRRNEHAWK